MPVKPCTQVGVSGSQVNLTTPIPNNVLCSLMGYTQTLGEITVSVISSTTGNPVATIQKKGPSTSPQVMTTASNNSIATFQSGTDTYYIMVTSNPTDPSGQMRVLLQYVSITFDSTAYSGTYTLIAEDLPSTGDCDFNDCTVYLSWNLFTG